MQAYGITITTVKESGDSYANRDTTQWPRPMAGQSEQRSQTMSAETSSYPMTARLPAGSPSDNNISCFFPLFFLLSIKNYLYKIQDRKKGKNKYNVDSR